MKKLVALFVISLFTYSAFSQLKFFAEAGINSSVPVFSGRLKGAPSQSARAGFTGSAGVVKKIGPRLQLNNKISFVTKRLHESFFAGPDNSGTNDYKLSAFQYHLLLEKDPGTKKKLHFIPSAGIYTSFHTSGEVDFVHSTIAGVVKGSRKLNFDKPGDFSRWDAGVTVGARLQLKKYGLSASYDQGLLKVDPTTKTKWGSFHLTLGYFFK